MTAEKESLSFLKEAKVDFHGIRRPRPIVSQPGRRQKRTHDAISGKIFPCDHSRGATVFGVVSDDRIDGSECLFMGSIFEEAAAHGVEFTNSRSHRYYWTTGSKIASATIAKPTAVRSDINVLCDRKLAARMGYKMSVAQQISGNRSWVN